MHFSTASKFIFMPTLNNVDQIRNQIYRILRDSYPEALSVRKIQEKLFEQGFIDITSDKSMII